MAQVRLEVAAGVMAQTEQVLLETPELPIDEQAIVIRCADRACGGCPCRKTCPDRVHMQTLPAALLHKPGLQSVDVPIPCRKVGRMVTELQRGQGQLRAIMADREQQREYREAVIQQYQFMAAWLRQLSDNLGRTAEPGHPRFKVEVAVCSIGKETANGDKALWFAGTAGRYYVLLCDGMGTGTGAAQEGRYAAELLRDMLTAGFPAEHALGSINSLLALRGRAGAVTVDLAQIELDTGRAAVYKWGAAPSWILREGKAEKIGTAGPPPGLSVKEGREEAARLSLRRGEVLILHSDGVEVEAALAGMDQAEASAPGELAASLLEDGCRDSADDATVAVIRLTSAALAPIYHVSPSDAVETQDVG